jgi:hypothetical protein
MRIQTVIAFLMYMLIACEESADLPLSSYDTNLVVVEGILTNENIKHRIKLTRPYKTQNETPEPISGAVVTIGDGTTIYTLTESPAGSGEYYTPVLRAVTGRIYSLSIQYNEKEYTAADSAVPVETLPTLHYEQKGDAYILTFSPSGQDANFIDHILTWENTSACTAANCAGKVVYYDLKTVDVNDIYKPDKTDFTFPLYTTIVRRKYSLSPAYRAFLRSLLSETEWRGGVFDVQRDNVSTNLSEGAIGFFAVSTVVSDTTIIQ